MGPEHRGLLRLPLRIGFLLGPLVMESRKIRPALRIVNPSGLTLTLRRNPKVSCSTLALRRRETR